MRRSVLLLSLGLVSALIVVAILFTASVERVTFTSGRPFDEDTSVKLHPVGGAGTVPAPLRPIDLAIAYGSVGLIVVAVILLLRKNAGGASPRKTNQWANIVLLATLVAAITVVFLQVNKPDKDEGSTADAVAANPDLTNEEAGPGKYQNIDELMGTGGRDTGRGMAPAFFLITGILAVVAVGLSIFLIVLLLRRKPRAREEDLTEEILAPVRAAVAELRLGRDPRSVVEHCYRQMLRALAERSRVDPACLTPREFVTALAGVGLDGAAIGELSTLFEEVHYGHRPEEALSALALQCMTAITTSYPAPEATP
ncbi:MAG: DUF4129 domain-containing protein [Candidatus Bipolaricaulota bacterium]|nr:DUF4129 domain-containing protein [Candidatus Bipolaricaulota bacterium]